jgi:hypothetical protein
MTNKLEIVDLKKELFVNHLTSIKNMLGGDEKKALKFMSSVVYSVNNTPKLLETLLNSFLKCAELNLYPSSVS